VTILFQYIASHPGQLSLLPSAGHEMSTSQCSDVGVKARWRIPFVDKRVGAR